MFLIVRDIVLLLILPQLLIDLLFLKVSETALRQAVGQQGNLVAVQLTNLIKQLHRGLVQQERFILRERGIGVARIADVVVDKQLVQCRVLHHTSQVGVAEGGEIVVGLALVAVAYRLAAFLRIKVAYRQRARATQGVDSISLAVNGIHSSGGVPVID